MQQTRGDEDRIYGYIKHLAHEKSRQETVRLLYVAATRARHELHLLGCARLKEKDQSISPDSDSFLKLLWPVVEQHYLAIPRASGAQPQPEKPIRLIRRLPLDWTLPAPPPAAEWKRDQIEAVETQEEVAYEWVGDTLRHIGTVLHRLLQRIAAEGIESWEHFRPAVPTMLRSLGVPPIELPEAVATVEKALSRTLRDERARWMLANQTAAESEYEITGLVDGKLYQARIDRTFIDEQGIRWIIDYKSSEHSGGDLDNFLENEKERYRPQLERYSKLVAQLDDRPIRLALYFPLLQAWREWAAPTVLRRQASLFE
jgi:ATP-dependent exoDNAse (exonuclease V) beta subunit